MDDSKKILRQLTDILDTSPSLEPDNLTLAARQTFDEEKEKIEVQRLKTEVDHLKGAFRLSNWLAIIIVVFVIGWMISVFGFLLYQSHLTSVNRLHDLVLIALLSTTTINILGLLFLVIRYVFNHRLKI